MKKLTQQDLPVLASLVRMVTHRKVAVFEMHLSVIRNNIFTVSAMIRDGEAFANDIIPGFTMKPVSTSSVWKWQIVI